MTKVLFQILFCICLIINQKSIQAQNSNDSLQHLIRRLEELIDISDITFTIKAYALSIDTRNWDLHRSIFTQNYKLFRNGKYKDEHIDIRINRLDRFTNQYTWTQHLASIYSIDIQGDGAFVISSVNARHEGKERENGRRSPDYLMTGLYHYWLIRDANKWKISKMRLIRSKQIRKLKENQSKSANVEKHEEVSE